jgi:hypothetical protein
MGTLAAAAAAGAVAGALAMLVIRRGKGGVAGDVRSTTASGSTVYESARAVVGPHMDPAECCVAVEQSRKCTSSACHGFRRHVAVPSCTFRTQTLLLQSTSVETNGSEHHSVLRSAGALRT